MNVSSTWESSSSLPAEIVPVTSKRQTRPEAPSPTRPKGAAEGGPGAGDADRQMYRKATDKMSEEGAES